MLHNIKKLLTTHLLLKTVCLMLGYGLWASLNKTQITTRSFDVPVCFYNTKSSLMVNAPETIHITLKGPRFILRNLDSERLGVHINSEQLSEGEAPIAINNNHLLLPESVKLVHYSPLPVIISLKHYGQNEQTAAL